MKHTSHLTSQLLAVGLIALGLPASAATYYVTNTTAGNDRNIGTSTSKPWKSLGNVNTTAKSGDVIYLAKGSIWNEALVVKSGVTYASYGTASAKPLINGAKPLGGLLTWTRNSTGSSIYKTSLKNVTTTGLGQLYLYGTDGSVTRLPRARHPNVGQGAWGAGSRYARIANSGQAAAIDLLPIEPGALPSNISSASLAGADAYVRIDTYEFVKYRVTGGEGNVLKTKRRSLDPMLPDIDSVPNDIIDEKDPAVTYNNLSINPGWGYWLENKAWMLDSPGEWYHDTATNTLYVQMPNGKTPFGQTLVASVLTSGITGTLAGNVVIRDIEVRDTRGDGIALEGLTAEGLIERVDVNRPGGKGIAVTNSTGGTINSVTVRDSIMQGVWMGDHRYPGTKASSNVHLTNSTISQAGRGYYAHSAVMLGKGSKAIGNTVEGSSAFGIHGWRDNVIERNFVNNTCMEFDDCGGIYVISKGEHTVPYGYALNTTISNNVVTNAPGHADGRLHNSSSTKGIYLDDFSQFVQVKDNFIANADVGYMLHFARNVTMTGNKAADNRYAALWLQENRMGKDAAGNELVFECGTRPDCDAENYLQHNTISNNTFASANGLPAVVLTSEYASTNDFGTFENNRYVTTDSNDLIVQDYPGRSLIAHKTLATWQALGHDQSSTHHRAIFGYKKAAAASAQLIRNGDFSSQLANWYNYQCDVTFQEANPFVPIMYVGSGTDLGANGRKKCIMHTLDALPLSPGKLYLASFEARSTLTDDAVLFAIRRNGPPYENLSTTATLNLTTNTKAFYRVLQTLPTVVGANSRLDIEFSANGTFLMDNVLLQEVNWLSSIDSARYLVNPSATSRQVYCPAFDATQCSRFVDASTGQAVSFPVTLNANSALVLTLGNSEWLDDDNDTVPNGLDLCPDSNYGVFGAYGNGCPPDN